VSRRAIGVLLAIPLLFTAVMLIEVGLNRRGDEGMRDPITLSERELYLQRSDGDNTSTTLGLSWRNSEGVALGEAFERELPRRGFVALARVETATRVQPGLVVVDVADDVETLERRYPDGRTHLITAATIRRRYVVSLDPSQLHVPRALAAQLPAEASMPPRVIDDGGERLEVADVRRPFRVSVRYGRHWVPWVVDVSR
jgi:hypothetical protein